MRFLLLYIFFITIISYSTHAEDLSYLDEYNDHDEDPLPPAHEDTGTKFFRFKMVE